MVARAYLNLTSHGGGIQGNGTLHNPMLRDTVPGSGVPGIYVTLPLGRGALIAISEKTQGSQSFVSAVSLIIKAIMSRR